MNFEQALEVASAAVFAQLSRHLSDVETTILRGAWQSQTYERIAETSGYSITYLPPDVDLKLWQLLSQTLRETVSETNFQTALERTQRRTQILKQWIVKERSRLVALLGMAGLARRLWAAKLAQQVQRKFEVVLWQWGNSGSSLGIRGKTSACASAAQRSASGNPSG